MGVFDLTVIGNKAILDGLDAVSQQIAEGMQGRLEEAGQMALERANDLVPVDTGYLQSRNQLDVQQGVVTVTNDAEYVIPVVFGHRTRSGSTVPPNDFLTPAWLEAEQWLRDSLPGLLG